MMDSGESIFGIAVFPAARARGPHSQGAFTPSIHGEREMAKAHCGKIAKKRDRLHHPPDEQDLQVTWAGSLGREGWPSLSSPHVFAS